METALLIILCLDIVVHLLRGIKIEVNVKQDEVSHEVQESNLKSIEEAQKKLDEQYQKEQQMFIDSARAVQSIFVDKEQMDNKEDTE